MGLQQRAYEYEYYGRGQAVRAPLEKPVTYEKKKNRTKKRAVPASRYVIIILAVVLVNVLLVCRQNIVLQRGYELNRLNSELKASQTENERLALTIGQLESLDRVEEIALTRLGMARASQLRLVAFQPTTTTKAEPETVASSDRRSWVGRIVAAVWGESTRVEASTTKP